MGVPYIRAVLRAALAARRRARPAMVGAEAAFSVSWWPSRAHHMGYFDSTWEYVDDFAMSGQPVEFRDYAKALIRRSSSCRPRTISGQAGASPNIMVPMAW